MRNKFTVAGISILSFTLVSFSLFKIEIHIEPWEPSAASAQESKPTPPGSFRDGEAGYYVIGYNTDNYEVALHESRRQNKNGFQTHVARSSNWSGFASGWYIVVYGIYDNKADAINALKQAEGRGVTAYIKHSGTRIR